MKECDDKDRKSLEATKNQHEDSNIEKFGNQCMITNDGIMDRPVREVMKTMDAMES